MKEIYVAVSVFALQVGDQVIEGEGERDVYTVAAVWVDTHGTCRLRYNRGDNDGIGLATQDTQTIMFKRVECKKEDPSKGRTRNNV